jgi:Tol biopolymer transport system component/tRNA A-37 threonylcarbamoyl transferase component Bud32
MALTVGTRLGPYEILSVIGVGGMGEVYKARDARLGRVVAVKISNEKFSERFEREARAVAALNHSNICHLYDVGPNYLVMEYVEGSPLKGPLPVDQALKYAAQICDALDAAHKKGITHRDLKPANILVAKTGIKLLDFGLAKMSQTEEPPNDATLKMALTGKNEIVGTLYYMSPEQLQAQASGKEIDARSDIFSFGLVLYEMLTGKRAFDGASQASVIAAILERPAPSIAAIAPPALDRSMQRCLAKDPDDRWQSARDLKAELDWIARAPVEFTFASAPPSSARLMPWVITACFLALGFIAASWTAYRATRPTELKTLLRFDVDLGPDVSLGSQRGSDVILSLDGTQLVYTSRGKLFRRKLDQASGTELPGTEGALAPFFSPDGQWVAFFDGIRLKKVSVDGGTPVELCDAPIVYGGSWGEDGDIIASFYAAGGLWRIPSAGGKPTQVTELGPGEVSHRWPQVLPGGKAVLFTSTTANGTNLEIMSLKDRRTKILQRGGTFGRYLATSNGIGHLVYMNNGTLFAVPLDPSALELRGTPVPVLEQVSYNPQYGFARFDVSQTGLFVYHSGGAAGAGLVTVQWLDNGGKIEPLLAKPGAYERPRLSPDGSRLALDIPAGSNRDIWIYEWKRDTMTRLTFDAGGGPMTPVWSPDGRYIVFEGKGGMYWTRSDGAGKPQQLNQTKNPQNAYDFMPDGKRLAVMEMTGSGIFGLMTMPVEADATGLRVGKEDPFAQSAFDERHPTFSSDGRWLAYASNESGTYQVYVRAFPDNGGKWQISSAGGSYPTWSHDGREIFFRSDENRIMVANYSVKGDSFVVDQPKVWSDKQLADFGIIGTASYDPAPDGKRIAALMPVETAEMQQAQSHVIFLENFFDELLRKAPLNGK